MSSYPLEIRRSQYEEVERVLRLIGSGLKEHEKLENSKSAKNRALGEGADAKQGMFVNADGSDIITTADDAEQVIRRLVETAFSKVERLKGTFEDDPLLKSEIDDITGKGDPEKSMSLFYERLKAIQSSHMGEHTEEVMTTGQLDRQAAMSVSPEVSFSGEEAHGKYLDLHESHTKFINLQGIDPEVYDYITFLQNFYAFGSLPEDVRRRPDYNGYIRGLLDYLIDFADRVLPLKFAEDKLDGVRKKAEEKMIKASEDLVDVSKYDSPQALEKGESPDALKQALKKMGLKFGGTPAQRAERLFKAHKKSANGTNGIGNVGLRRDTELMEAQVKYMTEDVLADLLQSTRMNVEKKLALSYEELEQERYAEENPVNPDDDEDASDSGEEKTIHNPKDVPLGWDGKPIPYWLYKLHGLNHEFRCEVCGDVTYRGPRNFERHFTEARHTHNLKMLGVQYSRYYYMVTQIDDVLKLAQKYRNLSASQQNRTADDEEFEDAEGNVFNRKTYEDLRRQGLL
ncbi:hypothetical protein NDN08_005084 [Rhodosorus marinus]|uniref:Matrin-type domain-containing protein n=1 Tax=Rhodosorus marinus TaxID=101924 RepID=A0AAV8V0I2_9RHOD|nr:hypothetical protein NDN08_005084 [Rhodosorus marinus]